MTGTEHDRGFGPFSLESHELTFDRISFAFHSNLLQNRSAAASLISEANSTGGGGSTSMTGNGGGLFSLIDTSLSAAPANMPDPWSTIVPAPATAVTAPTSSNHSNVLVAATLPFDNSTYYQSNNTNSNGGVGNQLNLIDSPWTPKGASTLFQAH